MTHHVNQGSAVTLDWIPAIQQNHCHPGDGWESEALLKVRSPMPTIQVTRRGARTTSYVRVDTLIVAAALGGALGIDALSAPAQSAREILGPTPLVAIQNEPPAKLIVDPPIPEQLAQGRVMIQYRTENLRILPVFGAAALAVSPRVGHLHYKVDDQSWPIVDTSGETIVLVGMKPGPHKVLFELADPTHKPIPGASKLVEFTVPDTTAHSH
jgi:hypothetical protein